ncbi:MAG: hypothetical protein D6736_15025 [Nitrospinota bacterium]|nr:MAG: hypothetical protein D6736_15025 [Nitrospinota bacterium]
MATENRVRKQGPRWIHRLALFTAGITFLLVCLGGLVTSKGVGLVVPDWPTTFGYNMFLFPWSKMIGGILYEHGHRLLATVVGFFTVLVALAICLKETRIWLRWFSVIILGFVILQGLIGGLRVILLRQIIASLHGVLAHTFFALMASLVLFTSREWVEPPLRIHTEAMKRLRWLSAGTTGAIYLQIVFGAVLRHTGSRLDAHLFFAGLVSVLIFVLAAHILRGHADQVKLYRPMTILWSLLLVQLLLGGGAYLVKFTPVGASLGFNWIVAIATLHVAVGSLMLVTSLVLTLRIFRMLALPANDPHLVSESLSV